MSSAHAHDDRVEAVAGAVGYWVEQMAADRQALADAHKAEQLLAALTAFDDSAFGRTSSAPLDAFGDILG